MWEGSLFYIHLLFVGFLALLNGVRWYLKDINTALAYLEMDYNGTARTILETLPDSENVCYLKAIVYARTDRDEEARKYFLKACELKPSLWHRGNLDPEISWLVKHYQLTH